LSSFNTFIQKYWTVLGATTIDMSPGAGPQGNCTAYILKWKAEGIQYIDMQDPEWESCLEEEQILGWTPSLGQGGPQSSQIGNAELLGKIMVGVIAGSPNTLYTGEPLSSSPTAIDRTYVGNIRTYVPQDANYSYLNGTAQITSYTTSRLMMDVLAGTLAKYGRVTSSLILKYTLGLKNWSDDLSAPIASFATNCKTGGEGTIWGYWHYNPTPTVSKPAIYMVPTSGPKRVTTNALLHIGKCYLTQLDNSLYPNG
jgi:hypothetical protein